MDHLAKLIACALFTAFSGGSFAGYAQLATPPAWTAATAANDAMWLPKAANSAWFGQTVLTTAEVNAGAAVQKVPVALNLAKSAAPVMARGFALNPWVLLATAAAPMILDWMRDANINYDAATRKFSKTNTGRTCLSDCFEYSAGGDQWFQSPGEAVGWLDRSRQCGGSYDGYNVYVANASFAGCNGGAICSADGSNMYCNGDPAVLGPGSLSVYRRAVPAYDTSSVVPLTPDEVATTLPGVPYPAPLPQFWPYELPFDDPVVNPKRIRQPSPTERPGDNPAPIFEPTPMRVPVGDPIPVPNTSPQIYRSPVVDIVPSPAPGQPWRVDIQPREVTKLDPAPVLPPVVKLPSPALPGSPPAVDPTTQTVNPNANPSQPSTATQPSLCEKFPDVLACAKPQLDTPELKDLKTKDVELDMSPDSGWGSGGSCPASKSANVGGHAIEFSYAPFCDFASAIKPMIVAFAWLAAAAIFIGAKK